MKSKSLVKAIPDIFTLKSKREFDPREELAQFESFKDVIKQRKSIVRSLNRYFPDNNQLVAALQACKKGWRCALLACPICMRRNRIWICDQIVPLVCKSPGEWVAVTLVPNRFRFPAGSLHEFNPQHLISALRRALKPLVKDKRLVVYGGIDYCVEVVWEYHWCHTRKKSYEFRFYWVPHLYLLMKILPEDRRFLDARLSWFSQNDFVVRPKNIKLISATRADALKVTTYAMKSRFYARYKIGACAAPKKGKGPIKQRIHGMCQAELATFFAHLKLNDRMILIGMKKYQKTILITGQRLRKNAQSNLMEDA